MRNKLTTLILLFIGLQSFAIVALEREDVYMNERMEVVSNKNKATYVCKLEKSNEQGHLFKVYFITGEVKMEGYYLDEKMQVPNGHFTYYYRTGIVESTGHYRNGSKYGIWQRYNADGTPKAEKIYAIQPMITAINDKTN